MSTHPPDIRRLLQDYRDRTGHSYDQIARATGLSKARIGQLAVTTEPYVIREATIQKLATGLRLDVDLVRRAAVRTAGIAAAGTEDEAREYHLQTILDDLQRLPTAELDFIRIIATALAEHAEHHPSTDDETHP